MLNKSKAIKRFLFLVTGIVFFSCSTENKVNQTFEISVTNWNVQTFFDGNNDGIEYTEFKSKSSPWNTMLYEKRLDKLCDVIEKFDSDIFVMEELENEKIIYDISNRLSHNAWFKNKIYNYAAFGKEEKASIGCGVISKYEIKDVKFHSLDIRTENEKEPSMRSIMELTLDARNRNVKMFVNHWKSKSGGEETSEKWRLWQENVLSREMMNSENAPVFAVGDFNKDIEDFSRDENERVFFTSFEREQNKKLNVFSPWDDDLIENGSYYFKGAWERIDHFFSPDENLIKEFKVRDIPEITNSDGTPKRYEIYKKSGASDHLPISCRLVIYP